MYLNSGLRPGKAYDVRVLAATKVGYPVLKDEKWPWVIHEMPDDVTSHGTPDFIILLRFKRCSEL